MPRVIGRDTLVRLLAAGAQLVEVLEASSYKAAHLPGAINIPLWGMTPEAVATLHRDRPLVVYCAGAD